VRAGPHAPTRDGCAAAPKTGPARQRKEQEQRARRRGVTTVSAAYRQDFAPLADRYLLLGTPDDVVERIGEFADAGADRMILAITAGPDDRDRVIHAIAEDALPRVSAEHKDDPARVSDN
jgi:alkanesulfonate monooxygenase SsuD/methylene tetrahydromethanopterin reductase-like flavin-dependent oxidoreductase (luciferase family)